MILGQEGPKVGGREGSLGSLGLESGCTHSCPQTSFVSKSATQPEKAVAPHSSTLVWKIPWTEEPGRLQSMGSLRVRHD